MGVSAAIRGGFGFLLNRHHPVPRASATINLTPTSSLESLFHRHRETPLPITPAALLRSMLQLDDLQALLWAWTLVGLLLFFAFCTNPTECSFRPFLTDLVFRERLRLLNDQDAADVVSHDGQPASALNSCASGRRTSDAKHTLSSLLSSTSYASTPFALTFGSKVALSVRTPPFHRTDLGFFSLITISQTMPLDRLHNHATCLQASRDGVGVGMGRRWMDCTSMFVGAFGKWWVVGFGIPDLSRMRFGSSGGVKNGLREGLEENLNGVVEWGVFEMRCIDRIDHHVDVSSPHIPMVNTWAGTTQPQVEPTIQPTSPHASTENPPIAEPNTEAHLNLTSLLTRSQTEIADLHNQLAQLDSCSIRTRQQLEADLEQLRTKKREEERLRLEIRSKTKALDDSKRHVEGGRREAERRLKAANASRALKQASVQHRKEQLELLNKRKTTIVSRKHMNSEKRLRRGDELGKLIETEKERVVRLRREIERLANEVRVACGQLHVEKVGGGRNGVEAEFGRLDQTGYRWNSTRDLSGHDVMYAQLASTLDPLVDSLSRFERLEQHSLSNHQYTPTTFNTTPAAHRYPDLTHSNASLQNTSNFEAIKQAFQPTPPTEEHDRHSWSAFDMWQSDLINQPTQTLHWTCTNPNTSTDSLPHFQPTPPPTNFVPPDRRNSGSPPMFCNTLGHDTPDARNLSKVKRAFRWPFRPSQFPEHLV